MLPKNVFAGKQLQLPAVTVDVMTGENRQSTYLAVNPTGQTSSLAFR
jgi:glutathione S-transferase